MAEAPFGLWLARICARRYILALCLDTSHKAGRNHTTACRGRRRRKPSSADLASVDLVQADRLVAGIVGGVDREHP